jgi:hypothetical protein
MSNQLTLIGVNFQRLALLGISKGLIKRGLLSGAFPHDLRITELGKTVDVTAEPAWCGF